MHIIRVGYKEWVNAVERLCDSCQWGPLTVLRVVLIGNNHTTPPQRQLTPYNPFFTDLHQLGKRIICPYFLQLSRESWWHNSQGRREFQIFSLMLAARFGYKHDQWQNTNPLFWRAFLIRINKHQRTQTTKPQALTTHNITLKLPYFRLPNITVPKKQIAKIVESH